jgi:acyl transferase domain-containing protein
MSDTTMQNGFEDIAIVGMAGRFPGAKSVEEFWQNVRDGVNSISHFSDEELEESGVGAETRGAPDYVRAGGVLEGAEFFDAPFFGLTAREAEVIDPQHRVFLESAWEALEDAGYDSETYAGRIAVYAGVSFNGYLLNVYRRHGAKDAADLFQAIIGNEKDHLATRVSYKLNLKGPSVNVQSACSTSLVAVCLACQSLLNYQADIALAGGVSVKLPQKSGYVYQQGGILSPDGLCRAFDASAEGTVGGNGVGIVVLKRLSEALADGDYIHAVIKGSAVNNDGAEKVGYTAPSEEAQAEVIAEAIAMSGVEAESITYVETHGTGTVLGDPIEISALAKAFRSGTTANHSCALGSVKTNIGHLDSAAGVAGLIKTVQALKHRQLPPSLHFESPNPNIDLSGRPFYVNTELSAWKAGHTPRRAGVSSFGIGGTNAHVVVEEAPSCAEAPGVSQAGQLLVLSAKT